jgi:hypothetical protein
LTKSELCQKPHNEWESWVSQNCPQGGTFQNECGIQMFK